jgi:alpha-mannosidase
VKLAVAQFGDHGRVSPVVRGVVTIHDHEPPKLINVLARKNSRAIELTFSKPVEAGTARDAKNYSIQPALPVSRISQSADGRQVEITFATAIPAGTDYTVNVRGVRDQTPYKNTILPTGETFNAGNIACSLASAKLPEQSLTKHVPGLPLQAHAAWTMNVLVKPDQQPDSRTTIVGFGENQDNPAGGTSRYFAVFDDGIRFWSANRDVITHSPLAIHQWQMLTATYDGKTLRIYKDGYPIGKRDIELSDDPAAEVNLGQPDPWEHKRVFHGAVRDFTIRREALSREQVRELYNTLKTK